MAWWHAVVESRHELQNPTSAEKIRLLGRELGVESSSRVLDIAGGRGGSALPDDPQADEFRARWRYHRDQCLRWTRDLMGWAIFVCRAP